MSRDEEAEKRKFDDWMRDVDRAVEAKTGCSVHDLEDCPFYDWFTDGVKPAAAANRAIKNSNGG